MTFLEQSKEALKNYWRTAVVIDDAAQIADTPQVTQLQAPGRYAQEMHLEPISELPEASFDASSLVKAFLEQNILCTVLNNKDVLKNNIEALLRSDILILDWKLEDDGEITTEFIRQCASNHPNALHMICIYTAENDLAAIKQKLLESSPTLNEIAAGGIYSIGSTYILVVNKSNSITNHECKTAEPENLPLLLLNEFASHVGGLLRNAVFHSIGAIRNNTHALLERFHPDLDPAFVTHRVYSKPCEDTEQHIIPLICSQIDSILNQEMIPQFLNAEKIEYWLNSTKVQCNPSALPKKIRHIIENYSSDILKNGIMSIPKIAKGWKNNPAIKKMLRESLLTTFWGAIDGHKSDIQLSMMMSCDQPYKDIIPILKSGTLLKIKGENNKYLICIQPPCDCIRIESKGRNFIFAHVSKKRSKESYDFSIIKNNKKYYLKIDNKAYNACLINFVPNSGNSFITAQKDNDVWFFIDNENNKYELILQLNEIHAIRSIQKCSNNLSRIGLMESDWQRRCSNGEHQ